MSSVDRVLENSGFRADAESDGSLCRIGDVLPEVLARYGVFLPGAGQRTAGMALAADCWVPWQLEVAC
jgi:hypothetical protein